MAKYGYIYAPFSGVEGDDYAHTYNFYVYWEVLSQSAKKNTTRLYLSWGLKKIASNTISVNTTGNSKLTAKYGETTLKDNGSVTFDMRNYAVGKHKSVYNKTVTVEHDATGRCEFPVYGWIDTNISLGTSEIDSHIELPVIPKDSFVTATDAMIGSRSLVYVGHSYDTYSHSIGISFGEISGWINADGEIVETETIFKETDIPFVIPESFYYQIPNAASGNATLALTTYENGTKIGEEYTTSFTVSVDPSACAPIASITSEDIDETAKNLSLGSAYVRYLSDVKCTITSEGQFGATIVSRDVNGISMPNDGTLTFVDSPYAGYTLVVTDSRGIKSYVTEYTPMVQYTPPVVTASGKRTDQTSGDVSLSVSGKWWDGQFGEALMSTYNNLTVSYRTRQSGGEWSEYTDLKINPETDYSFSATISGIDYRYVYEIEVMAQDSAKSVTSSFIIPKGIPLYDWGENDIHFNIPLTFSAEALSQTKENLGIKEPEAVNPADILAWKEIGSWEYGGSLEHDFTQYTEIMFVCDYYNDGFNGWGGGTLIIPVIVLRDDVEVMYFGSRSFGTSGFTVQMTTSKVETYGVYVDGSTYSGYKIYCYGR